MNQKLGWIDGHWGSPKELKIPIHDRGINFSDGIFETIFVENGKPQLLIAHLTRWHKNAEILGMTLPPNIEILSPILSEGIEKCALDKGCGSIRLNWSRGHNINRGIDIRQPNDEKSLYIFWIEISHIEPSFQAIATLISKSEKRNAESVISQCKTFNYIQSIQARREAKLAGFDDALLMSTTDEICCGTTANIIVKRNKELLTPRLQSGCLPGIMRAQGLKKGIFKEAKLSPQPQAEDEWLLINSLGCHPITKVNQTSTRLFPNPRDLWKSLLLAN
ncbi:aminotransferase class IV [Prochlorococcus marinus]|uniref:Aminotransferase class-IV n=1 Tax=Prochlorococcus marinus (strain MIT 9211) TaxID=93059 RepID=A9BDE4_PROM4|nr:aminotransferase class IV [Prochlorococcus marinus]ABX09757.1 Aminotransferase class-IV [Prochlorococcus marinus str. MIT 9211]